MHHVHAVFSPIKVHFCQQCETEVQSKHKLKSEQSSKRKIRVIIQCWSICLHGSYSPFNLPTSINNN